VIAGQDAVEHGLGEAIRDRAEDEMLFIEPDGTVWGGDVAVIEVYRRLGWPVGWLSAAPFRLITRPAYRYFANHRRWFSPWVFTGDE